MGLSKTEVNLRRLLASCNSSTPSKPNKALPFRCVATFREQLEQLAKEKSPEGLPRCKLISPRPVKLDAAARAHIEKHRYILAARVKLLSLFRKMNRCTTKLGRKDVVANDEVDRISELPEPILHQILSLLSTKDAPKTSVLSKTWYSTWNSFPLLDFDHFHWKFPDDPALGQGFYNNVNSSIARRCQNVSIVRFKVVLLAVCHPPDFKSPYANKDLERWIGFALSKNVEFLFLCYMTPRTYILRSSALFHANNKSVKALHLSGFDIVVAEESGGITDHHNNINSGCYFSSLKKLEFHSVRIDERILQGLLLNTCSLEEVSIDDCHGFGSVSLCSTKLKSVELNFNTDEVKMITIEAPNLQCLSLGGVCADVLHSILEASSKSYAKNLKRLVLRNVSIDDAVIQLLLGFGRELEKLLLIGCQVMEGVGISSCRLISKSAVRHHNVELVADCWGCEDKHVGFSIRVKNGLNKLILE